MKSLLLISTLFLSLCSLGQEEETDDYLFQAYEILEVTLLNELVESLHDWDSIQVIDSKPIYTIDSSWTKLEYPDDFSVKRSRNEKRIRKIETNELTAKLRYGFMGKIRKITFDYSKKERSFYYEGTVNSYLFEYEGSQIYRCNATGLYSNESYTINYY